MHEVMFRQANRLNLSLPLRVCSWKHPVMAGSKVWQMNPKVEYTMTENLSSGGCYFLLSQEPPVGARLELEFAIPGDESETPFAKVCCQGRVIRVDREEAHHAEDPPRVRVASTIERLADLEIASTPKPAAQRASEAVA